MQRGADDLLVGAFLVGHVEDADRAKADSATREMSAADEHERIEGVAVLSGARSPMKPVSRIAHGGEEAAIEHDAASAVVVFVLACVNPLGSRRNDDFIAVHRRDPDLLRVQLRRRRPA